MLFVVVVSSSLLLLVFYRGVLSFGFFIGVHWFSFFFTWPSGKAFGSPWRCQGSGPSSAMAENAQVHDNNLGKGLG